MKKIKSLTSAILIVAFLLLFVTALSAAVGAHRKFVIVASPFLDQADRESGYRETGGFVLSGAGSGDEIIVLDGVRLEIVAQFTIPEDEIYRKNPNARARALAKSLAALKQFFATDSPHSPTLKGTILVPQALNLIVTHLRKAGETVTVVFIGSAFYADENGSYNMLGGYVPSDQHIRVASRESLFGTGDKRNALQGVVVHYCFFHEAFDHADHRDAVHRFWYLLVGNQQGKLASFAASPTIAFHRVREGMEDPIMQAKLDEEDRELVMRRVELHRKDKGTAGRTNEIPVATRERRQPNAVRSPSSGSPTAGTPATNHPANLLPTNSAILTRIAPATIEAGRQGVGIVWSVRKQPRPGIDVDLSVKSPKSPVEVYFHQKETPGIKLLRDVVDAFGESAYTNKTPEENWEFVELDSDVPLRETTVWLNLFRNDSQDAVEGVIVVVTGGKVLQDAFSFPACLPGDRRVQAEQREGDPHWLKYDLRKLLSKI